MENIFEFYYYGKIIMVAMQQYFCTHFYEFLINPLFSFEKDSIYSRNLI